MKSKSEEAFDLLEISPIQDLSVRDSGIAVSAGPVLHAVDEHGSRHLLVPLVEDAPALEDSGSKGVSVVTKTLLEDAAGIERRFIDVKCEEQSLRDLFSTVCDEMLSQLEASPDSPSLVLNVVLDRWRDLLGPSSSSLLSVQAIKGLLAELHLLEKIAALSPDRALVLWTGVDKARHDFIGEKVSVEVKASSLVDEVKVHINGISQLAPPAEGAALYLLVERFERVPVGGDSVPDALDRLVERGIGRHSVLKAVGKVGVKAADLDAYRSVRFALLECRLYLVDEHFPRLVPDMLHGMPAEDRISGVEYWLNLGAQPPLPLSNQEIDALPGRIVESSEKPS